MHVESMEKLPLHVRGKVCQNWMNDYRRAISPRLKKALDEHLRNRGRPVIPICSKCSRPPLWFMYRCGDCNDFYFLDFISPRGHPLKHTCWECSQRHPICLYGKNLGFLGYVVWDFFDRREVAPLGFNELDYSAEDISDFDIFA